MIPSASATLARLQSLRRDPRAYSESFLKIRTKDRRLVLFLYNSAQVRLQAIADELRAAGQPVRLIVLKARQMGVSTWWQSQMFHAVSMHTYTNALVVSHDLESAQNLFEMSRLFYTELPKGLQPVRRYSNRRELLFDNPKVTGPKGLRSGLVVTTANDADAGRSRTIHYLHASEVAFWARPEETMLSLLQSVPDDPDTAVVIESTANGVGGWFYEQWQAAKRGESAFVPVFLPWHDHTEYAMPAPMDMTLSHDELILQHKYSLTTDQLAWRRWAIANNTFGDVDKFKQEYPSCDSEAFLVSGRPFFDVGTVRSRMDVPGAPVPDTGNLILQEGRPKFVPDTNGFLRIWHHPEAGRRYCIGADVAEGLAHGDYSAAQVLDNDMRQVAQWHGHIDPDEFGNQLFMLGSYYNGALIGPEVNNHGLTTLTALRRKHYARIYRRQTWDRIERKHTESLGWQTNAKTRPVMLDHLAACIRDDLLASYDPDFLGEALTFVRKANGRAEAQAGATDDLVIAMAIALQMHQVLPAGWDETPAVDVRDRISRHIDMVIERRLHVDPYLGSG